jgi:hypothetical protein
MTKTDARLALCLRRRRFEWALAHDEHARAAARLVAGKTHGLRNVVQLIQLASEELERRCDPVAKRYVEDLRRSAAEAQQELAELLAATRPPEAPARGAPIGGAVDAALDSLRGAFGEGLLDVRVSAPAGAVTRCTAEELEHLIVGLVLDVAEAEPAPRPIRLLVRERTIDGAPWIEIVRAADTAPGGDRFELGVVEAIARRAGGEVTASASRDGGEELVVALPEVA